MTFPRAVLNDMDAEALLNNKQADQGGATLIVLHQHIFRCVGIALASCNCVYNCPLMFSFHTQTIQ